jgi:putative nucleotidyltransferase with HDIG domain
MPRAQGQQRRSPLASPRLAHFKFGLNPATVPAGQLATRRFILDSCLVLFTALLTAALVGVGGQVPASLAGFLGLLVAGIGAGAYLARELKLASLSKSEEDQTAALLKLSGLTLSGVVIGRLFLSFGWPLFMIPLPLISAITTIAYGRRIAILHCWPLCGAVAVAVARWNGQSEPLLDVTFVFAMGAASTAMAFLCETLVNRGSLLRAGLISGLVIALAALAGRGLFEWPGMQQAWSRYQAAKLELVKVEVELSKLSEPPSEALDRKDLALRAVWFEYVDLARHPFWGLLSCVISGFLLYEILPWVERFFGVITRLHLLELADLNQPLLRRLNLETPGTYHHCQMVAMLSEAAAEAIGADSLLVRVGAYYHDIGKMAKPRYFTENNPASPELHGRLAPTLSTLVIHAHVKDGVELGRALGLPEAIIAFIPEHHGTTACEFFYRQAVDAAKARGDRIPDKELFRYPGPRPRSRETSILLIADSLEAAARSLDQPSPARIRNLVHEIIIDKLLDHQFADSPLSLGELQVIEDAMVRKLTWMLHARIKYPKKIESHQQERLKDLARSRRAAEQPDLLAAPALDPRATLDPSPAPPNDGLETYGPQLADSSDSSRHSTDLCCASPPSLAMPPISEAANAAFDAKDQDLES